MLFYRYSFWIANSTLEPNYLTVVSAKCCIVCNIRIRKSSEKMAVWIFLGGQSAKMSDIGRVLDKHFLKQAPLIGTLTIQDLCDHILHTTATTATRVSRGVTVKYIQDVFFADFCGHQTNKWSELFFYRHAYLRMYVG